MTTRRRVGQGGGVQYRRSAGFARPRQEEVQEEKKIAAGSVQRPAQGPQRWPRSGGKLLLEHMGRLWTAHLDPFLNSKATWVLEPFQVMPTRPAVDLADRLMVRSKQQPAIEP